MAVHVDKDIVARLIPTTSAFLHQVVFMDFLTIGEVVLAHGADVVLLFGNPLLEGREPKVDFSNLSLVPVPFEVRVVPRGESSHQNVPPNRGPRNLSM
jgi:hypothetical protein